jgi:hypothetical protein
MTCYVMVFATWSYQGVRAGYEDSTYTNDAATALNVLYRRMFAHSISFAGDPDREEKLLFAIFRHYYMKRYALSSRWVAGVVGRSIDGNEHLRRRMEAKCQKQDEQLGLLHVPK